MTDCSIHVSGPFPAEAHSKPLAELPEGAAICALVVMSTVFWGGVLLGLVL